MKKYILTKLFEHYNKSIENEVHNVNSISKSLINTGKCLTTIRHSQIWLGELGNFMSSTESDLGVDLIEITLDTYSLCNSIIYKEFTHHELRELNIQRELKLKHIQQIELEVFDINELIESISK